jgi:hypothetical protein
MSFGEGQVAGRHIFAAGATLNRGKAVVVFGGASAIPAGLSNAVSASSGGLSLNKNGATLTVRDGGGVAKNSFYYMTARAEPRGCLLRASIGAEMVNLQVVVLSVGSTSSGFVRRCFRLAFHHGPAEPATPYAGHIIARNTHIRTRPAAERAVLRLGRTLGNQWGERRIALGAPSQNR